MTKAEVAEKLKTARLKTGMTQAQVANAVGKSPKLVGHWETGYSQPDADYLAILFRLYNVDANEFFEFKTDKAPTQQELSKEAYDIAIRFDSMDEPGKALVRRVVDYIAPAEQIPLAASAVSHTDAEIAAALRGLTDSQADIPEVQQR